MPLFGPEHLATTAGFFLDLIFLPVLVRALLGEQLRRLRAEMVPHAEGGAAFFVAACRNDPSILMGREARSSQSGQASDYSMAGISFIGAGVILRNVETRNVEGLTTAATVWVAQPLASPAVSGPGARSRLRSR